MADVFMVFTVSGIQLIFPPVHLPHTPYPASSLILPPNAKGHF